jgi:F0F1-type ATP synthase epsilon subunit
MKPFRLACKILLINSLFCQSSVAKFSLESIKSFFFKKLHEQTVQKEFAINKQGILALKNKQGNITISEWDQATIQLKATKQCYKQEELENIKVETQASDRKVVITTKHKEKCNGSVDYELIVPRTVKVDITTEKGSILINKVNAPVIATTEIGDITISDTKGAIVASTQRGSININNTTGNIRATTVNGNITIDKASRNITAQTTTGAIHTTCTSIPALDTIALSTKSGNITLTLPKKINAELQARTARGKVTSEHYITVKPQTVQLNKQTWARLKKEVDGTLGTGEATIRLHAQSGNIKILKTT